MKMKSACVLLLILVLLEEMLCQGCWKQERESLLGLNARLGNPLDWQDGTDCCRWGRVLCNTTTGRVGDLFLWDIKGFANGHLNFSDFLVFEDLKSLYLSNNSITCFVENRGLSSLLPNLEVLDISQNDFRECDIASALSGLSSLKSLNLDVSQLTPRSIHNISKLSSLEILNLQGNDLNDSVLTPDWHKLKKLKKLDLSFNDFEGPLPSTFGNMTSLEYLDFRKNRFEVPISFTLFSNLSNLKSIYGDGNRVILDSHPTSRTWVPKFQLQVLSMSSTTNARSLPFPNFLRYQYDLTNIDFSNCKLEGEFPNWLLENNTKMEDIALSNCSFTGTFRLPSRPMLSLERIDVSNNYLSGELPKNIYGVYPMLGILRLSNNNLVGSVFPALSSINHLDKLYLDGNYLSGSIPSKLFNSSLSMLDMSNNHLMGNLPREVGNSSRLEALYLSNNHLEGSIPQELVELEFLFDIDISHNNLTGHVPSFVNSSVEYIHLSNNRLSGLAKRMFKSSPLLVDLSYNEISSNIHDMIQGLSYIGLYILILKANQFRGQIPKQLCHLTNLTILDLSYNNFVGQVPSCLGKMPFGNEDTLMKLESLFRPIRYGPNYRYVGQFHDQEKASFTTKKISYTYQGNILAYMSGIDLSSNRLYGNIPSELGNLTKIRALNLSHNYLTGKIPASLSNLTQVESLDLSFNKLSGNIPPQLNELTFLSVFSVAHNNLSGETPDRKGQFITFDESSYEDNPFLCGPPLPKSCISNGQPPTTSTNGDNDSLVDMYIFCVSFVVSYTLVLLVIAAVLYINPYWRRAWFYYIGLATTNCYYFIEDNLCKFLGNM